jgi:hypothetical protein
VAICAECCEATPYYADFECAKPESDLEGWDEGPEEVPSDPPPYVSPAGVWQPGMIGWGESDPDWKYRPGYYKTRGSKYLNASPNRTPKQAKSAIKQTCQRQVRVEGPQKMNLIHSGPSQGQNQLGVIPVKVRAPVNPPIIPQSIPTAGGNGIVVRNARKRGKIETIGKEMGMSRRVTHHRSHMNHGLAAGIVRIKMIISRIKNQKSTQGRRM